MRKSGHVVVVKALQQHEGVVAVQEEGLGTLCNLAFTAGHAKEIARAGAQPLAEMALKKYPKEKRIQDMGTKLLGYMRDMASKD